MCPTPQDRQELAPRDLAAAAPSAALVAALAQVDCDGLGADDQLFVVQAWERVAGWVAARSLVALAAFAGPRDAEGLQLERDELAAALRLGRGTAQARLDVARSLTRQLPGTLSRLEAGEISARHAQAVAEACADLTPVQVDAVESRVLPQAPDLTLGELRAQLRRAVAVANPVGFEVAHAAAAAKRRVVLWPEPDGMATVAATLTAADAQTVFLALDTFAHADRSDLGIAARRADALVTLAASALDTAGAGAALPTAHGRQVGVQVVVDAATLFGLADHPADLVGYGPIPASVARALAADASWQRLVAEPVSGHLLDLGHATYRPPQELRDFLIARDRVCSFPGCGQPAYRCELDHTVPFRPGRTSAANMGPVCKRHHQQKTLHGWQLRRRSDGTLRWTSPLGRHYDVLPTNHWPAAA